MADYLRAECTKAFRRKYLYIALLVCLAGESLLLLGSWLTYSWGNTNISFHSTAVMVAAILSFGLYATLITGDIVFSDQYKHNTLKNEVSYGLPRGRIYLGKLLVSMLVALAACVVLIGFYLGGCWLLFPHDGSDGTVWSLLGYCLAGAFPLWLGGQALVMACYFLVRSSTMAAFLSIGILVVLASVFQTLGLLISPVFECIRHFLPGVMLDTLASMAFDWPYVGLCWIVGAVWCVGSTAVGLAIFRRKEIR
ncbi:MAG: ABC transporter permease [Flavonifractor sp.]|nr:ABC transporter permease [Flavonifractor sp.]